MLIPVLLVVLGVGCLVAACTFVHPVLGLSAAGLVLVGLGVLLIPAGDR